MSSISGVAEIVFTDGTTRRIEYTTPVANEKNMLQDGLAIGIMIFETVGGRVVVNLAATQTVDITFGGASA